MSKQEIKDLLLITAKEKASDLHIAVGSHPVIRVDGKLIFLTTQEMVTPEKAESLVFALLTADQKEKLEKERELDFSMEIDKDVRIRANVFYQKNFLAGAFRIIPREIKSIKELGLPSIVEGLTNYNQGFVLIVGPTGHGKSTTMASLLEKINKTSAKHIVTIEDPIEYLFTQDRCIISQREVGRDTNSFKNALRAALREDPDVIMVGELRDLETISMALTAAETGHLVFGTLHTNNASQTIDRIIDNFPAHQQSQIRSQLANVLSSVISQRLITKVEGGRVLAIELLLMNAAAKNLIRENKIFQLELVIETNADEGMIALNRSLAELVKIGDISLENALNYSLNPDELKTAIK